MSSENVDSGPALRRGEERAPEPDPGRAADTEPDFVCREVSPMARDEGDLLRAIFLGLPLRAGFTDEVLGRLRESRDQTPIP
jgi:hypothetical protein